MGFLTSFLPLPAQAGLKTAGAALKKVPREVWYGVVFIVCLFLADCNGAHREKEKCKQANTKAVAAAQVAAAKQEVEAPKVVEEAEKKVEPKVKRRVEKINEAVKADSTVCDVPYSDSVQREIREAAAAADRM